MLDQRRDLFARLVISAQRNSSLNKPFRTSHVDFREAVFRKKNMGQTDFEKKVLDISLPPADYSVASSNVLFKKDVSEKIDEKVENIITNPHLLEIQLDLEVAEQLLKKIKSTDVHNQKIPLIEQTIFRLKTMLEQKSYV
jgi:hypothetical protein